MVVYTTDVAKEMLARIPDQERTFLLGIGHIANEVNVLQKLFYWASCSIGDHDLIRKAHTTQAITLAKVLAGKLSEAWVFLQKAFFASSLSKDWESKLQPDALEALKKLKKYFGRNNLVVNVRNRFAFHYSASDIAAGFALPPDGESWQVIMSESNANSLYYVADLVANYAMLESISPGRHQTAIERLIDELISVARFFIEFAGGCWIVATDMYLLREDGKMPVKEYKIEDAPALDRVDLPFFVEVPNKRSQRTR